MVGRADARLVAVIRELIDAETDTSTGTRSRLICRAAKAVEATYGPGVVPLPGRTTFYKVIDAVAAGRHTFGSAVTRRQTANRPQGVFTPTHAARPGEQVQIDSTPIDVMVLLDTGIAVRADLTIVMDVATRTICAAVLRPFGTKAVDAALLLAKILVPDSCLARQRRPSRPRLVGKIGSARWSTVRRGPDVAALTPTGAAADCDTRRRVIPAEVRWTVYTDLLAADLIADPYLDLAEEEMVWAHRANWWYALELPPRSRRTSGSSSCSRTRNDRHDRVQRPSRLAVPPHPPQSPTRPGGDADPYATCLVSATVA